MENRAFLLRTSFWFSNPQLQGKGLHYKHKTASKAVRSLSPNFQCIKITFLFSVYRCNNELQVWHFLAVNDLLG